MKNIARLREKSWAIQRGLLLLDCSEACTLIIWKQEMGEFVGKSCR